MHTPSIVVGNPCVKGWSLWILPFFHFFFPSLRTHFHNYKRLTTLLKKQLRSFHLPSSSLHLHRLCWYSVVQILPTARPFRYSRYLGHGWLHLATAAFHQSFQEPARSISAPQGSSTRCWISSSPLLHWLIGWYKTPSTSQRSMLRPIIWQLRTDAITVTIYIFAVSDSVSGVIPSGSLLYQRSHVLFSEHHAYRQTS